MPVIRSKYDEVGFAKYLMLFIYIPMSVANWLVQQHQQKLSQKHHLSRILIIVFIVLNEQKSTYER